MHILSTIINFDVQKRYCKTVAYLYKDSLIDIYLENNPIYMYSYKPKI